MPPHSPLDRTQEQQQQTREGRSVNPQPLPESMIGRNLSRYRVVEQLGGGGMGVVYRGHDPRLGRDVAIKVLPARTLADERTRQLFLREAQALSKLNHPHIAAIFDFDSQEGTDFLVMEFVPGAALSQRVRNGPMSEPDIVRILSQVAGALVEAHERGLVHRDLKPENILITPAGMAKILDFGVARFLDSAAASAVRPLSLTDKGHIVGTLPYLAPEVISGAKAEQRSDLYSLGVIAFVMATGRRPFPNDEPHELMYTIVNQEPPRPRIINGRISEALESLILRLLYKRPEQRFDSARSLVEALRSLEAPNINDRRVPS